MTSDADDKAIREIASRAYDRDHTDTSERASTIDFAFGVIAWLRANGWSHTPPAPPVVPPKGLRGAAIARHALAQAASNKEGGTDGR
ncbi:hypothetical protein HII36_05640 [Nonomuraea sp. NN258]|uniref:hypothetical protein n=1 Tax=Nonomuraea antri TaxID=2730852 RepID=UPI0015695319|nr:hypothetical protein [Nonomuraea antri]NRQ31321.1 hypothetical protein [Nonomuraea antri]